MERKQCIAFHLERFAIIANRAVTPALLEAFEAGLSGMRITALRRGFEGWLRDGDRFPWPSDIRGAGEL